jgi:hypothetical protein
LGKILDLLLSKNWEEYQRIQLYKKIGNKFDAETKAIDDDKKSKRKR